MAKNDVQPGISARLVHLLEAVRPIDPFNNRPMSDAAWCKKAKVNEGFWRDLRKGTDPSIDRVERMANAVGMRLSELVEGAEAQPNPLPSEDEMSEIVQAVQSELPVGATIGDYPHYVGPALLTRLRQYASVAQYPGTPVRDGGGQSHRTTKPSAPAE